MRYEVFENCPDPPLLEERFIHYALKIGALELFPEGRTLKSGRVSPYFFNSGLFCTAEHFRTLIDQYARVALSNFEFDVIFGLAYKGIPLAIGCATLMGGQVGYAFNRKEAKDHGEGGEVVGASMHMQKVLIVDDVITTGGSANEAVEIVKRHGGFPVGCVIAFDRQESEVYQNFKGRSDGAIAMFEERWKIPVKSVVTFRHLIDFVDRVRYHLPAFELEDILKQLNEYRNKYRAQGA